ncbi:uncharacterized, partial [Tachysurus ichikawai]
MDLVGISKWSDHIHSAS